MNLHQQLMNYFYINELFSSPLFQDQDQDPHQFQTDEMTTKLINYLKKEIEAEKNKQQLLEKKIKFTQQKISEFKNRYIFHSSKKKNVTKKRKLKEGDNDPPCRIS